MKTLKPKEREELARLSLPVTFDSQSSLLSRTLTHMHTPHKGAALSPWPDRTASRDAPGRRWRNEVGRKAGREGRRGGQEPAAWPSVLCHLSGEGAQRRRSLPRSPALPRGWGAPPASGTRTWTRPPPSSRPRRRS